MNRETKRRASRSERASAAESRKALRRRSRPLRVVIVCASVIVMMLMAIIPTFAQGTGTNEAVINTHIPFQNTTLLLGKEGDYTYGREEEITFLPNGTTSIPTTGVVQSGTDAEQDLSSKFLCIRRLHFYTDLTSTKSYPVGYYDTPNFTLFMFWNVGNYDNTPYVFTGIRFGAEQIFYVREDNTAVAVYDRNDKHWVDGVYRNIVFEAPWGSSNTTLNKWLDSVGYVLTSGEDGKWKSAYYSRHMQNRTYTDRWTENNNSLSYFRYTSEIPSSWIHDTQYVTIMQNAKNFAYRMSNMYEGPLNEDDRFPFTPQFYIWGETSRYNEIVCQYDITFSIFVKTRYDNRTELELKSYRIQGNYATATNDGIQIFVKDRYIPINHIRQHLLNQGVELEQFFYILVDDFTFKASVNLKPWETYESNIVYEYKGSNYVNEAFDENQYSARNFFNQSFGDKIISYAPYQDADTLPLVNRIGQSVGAFLNTPIISTFTLGNILLVVIAVALVFIVLKMFAGG